MSEDSETYYSSGFRAFSIRGNEKMKGTGGSGDNFEIDDSGIHIQVKKTDGKVTDILKQRNVHIQFHEIENVDSRKLLKAKLVIHTDANTYRITGLSPPQSASHSQFDEFSELTDFLKERAQKEPDQHGESTSNERGPAEKDDIEKLRELAEMRDEGLISDDEFDEMRTELID